MGIPAFYRWLVEKYPRTVVNVVEETPVTVNGLCIPLDTSKPNPNGVEFDNLYLDMNGIIHPCFHPQGLPAPMTYDDVFKGVFKYIDRIFAMIRPRKLLYMAIDGVAPRAKMNQQRVRRFKAAKEIEEASKRESLTRVDGSGVEEGKVTKLDSNVITPGTEFMEKLSSALRYYIHLKMNSDPGWQGIKVILSDASVPGEGEHKIMSYIRLQRRLPGSDPNTRHCLYGLDADLIMLALATHEVHFSILREDVRKEPKKNKGSKELNYSSELNMLHNGIKSIQGEEYTIYLEDYISKQSFQFLNIWVLREYLELELRTPNAPHQLSLERFIDDFVFMCLFIGNDFLPHVPSLEISEGAIDMLMKVYKTEFERMGGYLTKSTQVYLANVEHFVQAIGAFENGIFKKRNEVRKQWEKHFQRRSTTSNSKEVYKSMGHVCSEALGSIDKVKLGEDGWKERYYCENFEVRGRDECERIKGNTVLKYVEGICWVMRYYYQGVCSWNWFYPYHYAPFASDFQGLGQLQIDFFLGKPLKPLEQLMAVLPASSAQALPSSYGKLMTDPSSPILDFYPRDFELDMNGKRHAWQAVCKLPFIEELRLLSEIEKVEHTLTDDEKRRNSFGLDQLFFYTSHQLATTILKFWKCHQKNPKINLLEIKKKIESEFSDGMHGFIVFSDKPLCPVEIFSPIDGMELIKNNKVVSTFYQLPKSYSHSATLSKGVIFPEKSVSEHDVEPSLVLWHEKTGFLRSRISQRRIPPRAISGSCLAKLSHQLVVSQSNLVKQNGSYADEYMKNSSGVRKSEENYLMVQKVRDVAGANYKLTKEEQTCSVEPKDNNVDCSGESKSQISKRKGVPDKIEKKRKKENRNNTGSHVEGSDGDKSEIRKREGDGPDEIVVVKESKSQISKRKGVPDKIEKKRKKENRNNTGSHVEGSDGDKSEIRKREGDGPDEIEKENRNNVDRGTDSNSEDRTGEQNCQVDQNFFDVDGESEKNAEVSQREEIIIVEKKDNNVDGSGKNKSQKRERAATPEAIEKKRKKNRNSVDSGTTNKLEDRTIEQNCQVDSGNGEIENNSEHRTREQSCQMDSENGEIENNSAGRGEKQNLTMEHKDNTADAGIEKNSKFRKRQQNCVRKQKGRNLNGSGENKCQIRKEGDMPNKIEKRKEKDGNSADKGEQSCHVHQEDCNLDGEEGKSNSNIRERQHNFIAAQKDSNEDTNIEDKSQVWRRECDTQNVRIIKKNRDDVDEGTETNFVVKRRELNGQQKDNNADGEFEIPIVQNEEQNDSTVDASRERNPEVRIKEQDIVDDRIASKKTMSSVDNGPESNSRVVTREQNTCEVNKREQNYLMEQRDNDVKGISKNNLVVRKREREMPDDKVAKKKNKKRKLKNAQKP